MDISMMYIPSTKFFVPIAAPIESQWMAAEKVRLNLNARTKRVKERKRKRQRKIIFICMALLIAALITSGSLWQYG